MNWLRSGGLWLAVAVLASLTVVGLDLLQIPLPVEMDASAGWFGLVASPFVAAIWRMLYQEARQRDRDERNRQEDFRRSLTSQKVAGVYEDLLDLVGELEDGAHSGPFSPGRPARLRRVRKAVYQALVYVHDAKLIELIVQVFEATVRGQRTEVTRLLDEVAGEFREHLTAYSGLVDAARPTPADQERLAPLLARLNKALIGLTGTASVQPVLVKWSTSLRDWSEVRFARELSFDALVAISNGLTKTSLAELEPGDVLVYWRDSKDDSHDGALGLAWVQRVHKSRQTIVIGRRITVSLDRMVRFSGLVRQWHANQHTSHPVVTALTPAKRLAPEALDYDFTVAFAEVVEALDLRRSSTHSRELVSVNGLVGRLGKLKGKNIRLFLDFNRFVDDRAAERFLEELTQRWATGGDTSVQYAGDEYRITSIKPFMVYEKSDPFEEVAGGHTDDLVNRAFTAVNLAPTGTNALRHPPGWRQDVTASLVVDERQRTLMLELRDGVPGNAA